MSKTLEQTIHEADLPVPASGGEDFHSYVSRVAHAAAFIGAAWAIANGPQAEMPQPVAVDNDGSDEFDHAHEEAQARADTFAPEPGSVQRSEE